MIERGTRKVIIEMVDTRDIATLIPIILKYVRSVIYDMLNIFE